MYWTGTWGNVGRKALPLMKKWGMENVKTLSWVTVVTKKPRNELRSSELHGSASPAQRPHCAAQYQRSLWLSRSYSQRWRAQYKTHELHALNTDSFWTSNKVYTITKAENIPPRTSMSRRKSAANQIAKDKLDTSQKKTELTTTTDGKRRNGEQEHSKKTWTIRKKAF